MRTKATAIRGGPHTDPDESSLKRLVRSSLLIDAAAKQHWLLVLPHLTPTDRERLRQILVAGSGPAGER